MVQKAKENHIDSIMAVVKVFAGHYDLINSLVETGIHQIGDSRIENLKLLTHIQLPKCLLRLPMISEVDDVVQYADISLNSEIKTIKALNQAAKKSNINHQIILMFDLGDLREGLYYSKPYIHIVENILDLSHIELLGIGANLTCYGGLVPNKKILNRLIHIKDVIESKFNLHLKIVSGGNSSTVTLFDQSEIPKAINHLRLGESILFGKETSYGTNIEGLHQDNFIFEAEIIECQTKPSLPDGDTSINSFGEKVQIEDKGAMKRAILAIGKQDVMLNYLKPIDTSISIIGGSSDHLILDVTGRDYDIGQIVQFRVDYPGLLLLMNSNYVKKIFK